MLYKIEKYLVDNQYTIQESQILSDSEVSFWHSNILDKKGNSFSAGFSQERINARKIAISEFLERKTYLEIAKEPQKFHLWGLDIIPTACGFAAGFNQQNTIIRSISESAERWVMSKWIDDHYFIETVNSDDVIESLDSISKFFVKQFDSVLFYSKKVLIDIGGRYFSVTVAQTMGLKNGGIFPGSSAQTTGGSIWQHALLESFRHLQIIKNNTELANVFPDNKVRFFAKNASVALAQIQLANKKDWPLPKVLLHHIEDFEEKNFFVARTILDGWRSWHEGPIERFLY